jgi:predicted branched-subunit amino acid permease
MTAAAAGTADTAGAVFAESSRAAAAAIGAPLGLVGANVLPSAAPMASFGFSSEHSFASLLASAWPAGTTQLRAAAELVTQTLAAEVVTAGKPLAVAAAAAAVLYAVAPKAKKPKATQTRFSERLIRIA